MHASAIDRAWAPPASLAHLARRETETCGPQTPVRQALERMRARRIGSVIVVDAARAPIGILTLRDVLDRIALEPGVLDAPIERVMSPDPVRQHVDDDSYHAALLMMRHAVRHVVLVHGDGTVAGVASERDLFGMQATGIRHLSDAIHGASDLAAVEAYGRDIGGLARRLIAQGTAIGPLTAFISSLIDLLTERIVSLEFAQAGVPFEDVCWIVLGSEGRSEQTLATDQDNGIVFRTPRSGNPDEMRARLVPVAQRINQALDRAGYRLCPGNIMAGNPECCLSQDEWRGRFARWIASGSPRSLLHGAIFFDLRPLTGEKALADELRTWLLREAARNPRFLHQMTQAALQNRPALGFLHRFATDDQGRIDLKRNGAAPFVDCARILSLGAAVDEVRTETRLAASARRLGIRDHEVDAWIAAFHQIQGYRLRRQAECLDAGAPPDNRLDPDRLHDFDRQLLRSALEQARNLQRRVMLDYGAGL